MTNTTNESEAMEVWRMAKQARHLAFYPYDGTKSKQEADQAAARVIATTLEARDARIAELSADNDALFDALFDAIAMMGHAMNLSVTAMIGGEVLKAQEVWQKGHDLLLGKRTILTKGNTHD